MTQNTDQERTEFEAWSQANNKYHISGYNPHNDLWEAWQAARSAPAAPAPQGWKLVPIEPTEDQLWCLYGRFVGQLTTEAELYSDMLAAAPQPPEAAQAAVPVGTKFFSFDPNDDLVVHDTAEAACAAAQQSIDLYREDAADGWDEEVERVCWGMILGQALETLSEDLPPDAFAAGVAGSLPPVDYVLHAPAHHAEGVPAHETCETCQGNGEIVKDWDRYKHPHVGDKGDEAVSPCPDCGGTGEIPPAHPAEGVPAPVTVVDALQSLIEAIQFTPLGVRQIHAMERAREALAATKPAAQGLDDEAFDDFAKDVDDSECISCSGTGEGMYDGQSCVVCRGKGFL